MGETTCEIRIRTNSIVQSQPNEKEETKKFTCRQWMTLIVFGATTMLIGSMFALQGPFYPKEAESKGSSATEYGFVFGTFQLTFFIISPVYGKYMNKIGPKRLFNIGIIGSAISCTLFGFLNNVDDHFTFIALSIILRICEGVSGSAVYTTSFTILAAVFPFSIATSFAWLEALNGLGLIGGPAIGGVLFQLGGFTLPFVGIGVLILLITPLAAFFMPKIPPVVNSNGKEAEGFGLLCLLKVPAVFLSAATFFMGAVSSGFLTATLEPHLRQFDLAPNVLGAVFMINGSFYAACSPVCGWICDKISQPKVVALFGVLAVAFGYVFMAPFVPHRDDSLLPLICVGLVLHGLGLAACFVSLFITALKDAVKAGFPDNITTYAIVSGMWACVLSLGSCIGPVVGGILLDYVGFKIAALVILGGEAIVGVAVLWFIIYEKGFESKSSIK